MEPRALKKPSKPVSTKPNNLIFHTVVRDKQDVVSSASAA